MTEPTFRDSLVLDAARIAEAVVAGRAPSERSVFDLACRVLRAHRVNDRLALQLGLELATALLGELPTDPEWSETRGRLWAVRLFAWLLQSENTV